MDSRTMVDIGYQW